MNFQATVLRIIPLGKQFSDFNLSGALLVSGCISSPVSLLQGVLHAFAAVLIDCLGLLGEVQMQRPVPKYSTTLCCHTMQQLQSFPDFRGRERTAWKFLLQGIILLPNVKRVQTGKGEISAKAELSEVSLVSRHGLPIGAGKQGCLVQKMRQDHDSAFLLHDTMGQYLSL